MTNPLQLPAKNQLGTLHDGLWARSLFRFKTRRIETLSAERFIDCVLPGGSLQSARNIAFLIGSLATQEGHSVKRRIRTAFLLILSGRAGEAAPLLADTEKPALDEIIRLLKIVQQIAPQWAVSVVSALQSVMSKDLVDEILGALCKKLRESPADAAQALLNAYRDLIPANASVALGLERLLPATAPLKTRLALFEVPLQATPIQADLLQRLLTLLADEPAALVPYVEAALPHAGKDLDLAKTVVRALLAQQRIDAAIALAIQALDQTETIDTGTSFLMGALTGHGYYQEMERLLARLLPKDSRKLLLPFQADLLTAQGALHEAEALLEGHLASLPANAAQRVSLDRRLARIQMVIETAGIFARVPQPQNPVGVAVILMGYSPLALLWHSLTAIEMRKHGYATILLDSHTGLAMGSTGVAEIDGLNGMVTHRGRFVRGDTLGTGLRADWAIDVDKKIIRADGMNVYQPIYERIGTQQRRYSVDMHAPQAHYSLTQQVATADTALAVCQQIKVIAAAQDIQVRFLGSMSHYVPAAVYRKYCAAHPGSKMEFVSFLAAYQHYYNNLANTVSTALSVENMTRHPELRMSCHAYPEQFEAWIARQQDVDGIIAEVDRVINMDRARKQPSDEAEATMRRIQEHRAKGGRVVCLFGKIMYDICVEEEGGPCHADMIDWLNHSIEAVRGHDDILLLIKPHPNEIKPEVADPTEFFFDGIQVPLPDNVIKLEHRWFNINDIVPVTDMGVMWHGTTTLEFMARGIPVVVCATWGIHDHPVEVVTAMTRPAYEEILRHPERHIVSEEQRRRAALLINYLASDDIIVPYDYGHMPVFRNVGGNFAWFKDKVEVYLRDGDPHIAKIAARCL